MEEKTFSFNKFDPDPHVPPEWGYKRRILPPDPGQER
jgi:hypothetical protein